MSFSTRHTVVVLLAVLSLAVTISAQSTSAQAGKAPRGSVSGRVTIKDKGAAGVGVGLRKGEGMNPSEPYMRATTDQDGFYRIANVPPGTYEVAPSAPAFVSADNLRKNVVVGEDDNVEGINFSLVRGGVITGRITDADGRPVIQQMVNLFLADAFTQSQQQQQQQRQVFPASSTQTDDRGIYRVYGLRAGRYKVATGRSDDVFNPGFSPVRSSYKQVFYPDVTDQAKATIIEVSEGSEATNVDIKLGLSLQTFSASGRVMDSDKGVPVPNIHFALQRLNGQRMEFINPPLTTNAQGDFYAEGLVAGKYQIYLFQEMNGDLRAEAVTFDIIDQDVSNVVVKLTKGASITGVVVLESEDKKALQKLLQLRLLGYVSNPGTTFNQSSSGTIAPDGSFRLGGLPAGTANIQLQSMMGPFDLKGFAITRIERDGMVLPRGIEVKEGEQISGLRVVVAYGNGSISGIVKVENGTMPAGTQLYVRLSRQGDSFSGFRPSPVDSRGHFLIEGIPPGNYEVAVQIFGTRTSPSTSGKREVNVQDGVVTDVVLTVDVATIPTPPKP